MFDGEDFLDLRFEASLRAFQGHSQQIHRSDGVGVLERRSDVLERTAQGLSSSEVFSPAEAQWVLRRLAELLGWDIGWKTGPETGSETGSEAG